MMYPDESHHDGDLVTRRVTLLLIFCPPIFLLAWLLARGCRFGKTVLAAPQGVVLLSS
jgi:hypothetical protein